MVPYICLQNMRDILNTSGWLLDVDGSHWATYARSETESDDMDYSNKEDGWVMLMLAAIDDIRLDRDTVKSVFKRELELFEDDVDWITSLEGDEYSSTALEIRKEAVKRGFLEEGHLNLI